MEDIDLDEEMDMPCPCEKCGEWFELNDGKESTKRPNLVICRTCGESEKEEAEREEEIEDLKSSIQDAEYTIRDAKTRLKEFGINH